MDFSAKHDFSTSFPKNSNSLWGKNQERAKINRRQFIRFLFAPRGFFVWVFVLLNKWAGKEFEKLLFLRSRR